MYVSYCATSGTAYIPYPRPLAGNEGIIHVPCTLTCTLMGGGGVRFITTTYGTYMYIKAFLGLLISLLLNQLHVSLHKGTPFYCLSTQTSNVCVCKHISLLLMLYSLGVCCEPIMAGLVDTYRYLNCLFIWASPIATCAYSPILSCVICFEKVVSIMLHASCRYITVVNNELQNHTWLIICCLLGHKV